MLLSLELGELVRKCWSYGLSFFAYQQVRQRRVSLPEGETGGRVFWHKLSGCKETGEVILMSKLHRITRKWAPWSSLTSLYFF